MQFVEAFGEELEKLAFDNPVEGAASAINSTQGRNKQLAGKMPSAQVRPLKQSVPAPETSPPSMLRY